MRSGRLVLVSIVALVSAVVAGWVSFTVLAPQPAHAVASAIDNCVAAIDDPSFTKAFILSTIGYADDAAVAAAVSSGALTVQVSTGAGWTPQIRGNNQDVYCGTSANESIADLDSNASTRDFFFGGGGNDQVPGTIWYSTFYGGAGDDYVNAVRESSRFYGGPGTDSCGFVEAGSTCEGDGGPALGQAALSVTSTAGNMGSTLSLTTSGGSGSGAVTFAVTTSGTAGCSVAGSTLSYTSYGTCTVTATKAADGTYSVISSPATTITISRIAQSALSLSSISASVSSTLSLTTTGGSGTGAVTFAVTTAGTAGCSVAGSTLSYTSHGTCTVTATKAADNTYLSESSPATTVTVSRLAQAAVNLSVGAGTAGTPLTLAATGGSGTGAFSYTVTSAGSAGCTVSGAQLTAATAGTCTVTATKAADSTYSSETSSVVTVTFAAAPTTTTVPPTTVAPTVSTVWSSATTNVPVPPVVATTLPTTKSTTTTTTGVNSTPIVTTTTTTVPVQVTTTTAVPSPPKVGSNGAGALVDGKVIDATVQRIDNVVAVSVGSTTLKVAGTVNDVVTPLGADGSLQLTRESGARITATGLRPGSRITAWLFSAPSPLGSAAVDESGEISGTFPLPPGAKPGVHRIVVDGLDAAGKPVTFSVAATLLDPDAGTGSTFNPMVLVLPLVIAAFGALFLPAVLRRRRDQTA